MNERSIFLEALDKDDPTQRAALLEEACAGDADLRQRVEALLKSHAGAGDFLGKLGPERVAEQLALQHTDDETQPDAPEIEQAHDDLGFLTPSEKPDSLGRMGHYEVQEIIGRGGMGVVLRAFDEKLHRVVAIKVMAAQLATNATARKRFTREAQAQAAVSHDHIVTIHAVEEANGLPYLVMQYVAGMSLQERLEKSGPLQLHEILRIGMQTASGLAAAHAQGLVHRDIKPANILLENGVERVKITDFGLARAATEASLTQSGVVAGTPQYMSPEQAEGKAIDQRTDLFSLGSVLYAMCTGRAPFRASGTMAVLKRVCEQKPTPIREANAEIPEWLVAIIAKLHAKDPAERYRSAAEVAELLGRHLAQVQHPSIVSYQSPEAKANVQRTQGRRLAIAAAVVLCLVAGLSFSEATGVTKLRSTVVRIFTPEGTLVVETDDPGVKVTIEGDGGLVITGAGLEEIRLRPGSYKVHADRDGTRVHLDRELVSIAKNGREIVKVKLEAPPAPAVAKTEKGTFVLVAAGKERQFDSLADAVQSASPGDTIEVRGNGPFTTGAIQTTQSLTIRAGEGFRPVINFIGERVKVGGSDQFLTDLHASAQLCLEGLELRRIVETPPPHGAHVSLFWTKRLDVANCRFLASNISTCVLGEAGEVRNCEFICRNSGSINPSYTPAAGRLVIDNCLHAGGHVATTRAMGTKELTVQITRNTFRTIWSQLRLRLADGPPPEDADGQVKLVRFEALGNIFDARNVFFEFAPRDPGNVFPPGSRERCLANQFGWQGERNLYSVGRSFLMLGFVGKKETQEPTKPMKNLVEWKQFWGSAETGSIEGNVRYQGGDLLSKLAAAPEKLTAEDFRLRPDSAGYRAGKDGKDLGADVDLVGPGAAYERWKKTPDYQQWLKDSGQIRNVKTTELTREEVRERQAAELLLRKGASLTLMSADFKYHVLEKPGQSWPAGACHVHAVKLSHLPSLTLADLTALRDFPRLRAITLVGSPVTTAAILDQIEGGGVGELRLNGLPTTSREVTRLAKIKTLSALFLSGTGLTDDDIAQLADLPLLNDVNVGGNQITDESLKHLARLPLKRLFVSRTKVTDVGLALLHPCKNLGFLNVADTGVTAEGVADLRKALPKCEIVWGKDGGKGK